MSYQLLHILSHGCSLRKERGQLVMYCGDGQPEKRCPLEEIRAVIIAARGVSFSSDLLKALCENQAVILHCDEHYAPCGLTAPLSHTVNVTVLERQCECGSALHRRLWERIVTDKIRNQERVLVLLGEHSRIPCASGQKVPDEAFAARYYWHRYFGALGMPEEVREQESGSIANKMLNYGYAVLAALLHRSIVIHGLIPEIGFHHCIKYAGYPLVYDLMEPFRPFVDFLLILFAASHGKVLQEEQFSDWCRKIAKALLAVTLQKETGTRSKFLYAIDEYVAAIAACLAEHSIQFYWSPALEHRSFQDGVDHNDV